MNCIKHKIVKARKEHRCGMCDGKIKVGETYKYSLADWVSIEYS